MQSFQRNGASKEMLFNLTEVALKEEQKNIGDKVIYFSNVNHFLEITQHEAFIVTEKPSDHEEADTKLVAQVEATNFPNGKTVLIRSPSGDTDIIVLFILHEFDGIITIIIDNGLEKEKLQICQHLYYASNNARLFQKMTMCLVFSGKIKKVI